MIHHLFDDKRHLDDYKPRWIDASQAPTWYMRTGLGEYLQDLPIAPFLSWTKTPGESGAETGPAQAIWNAAARMVQVGEQILTHSDEFILKNAARIHPNEAYLEPLQALKEPKTLSCWSEPWQRVLMFFVRTQVCHLVSRKRWTIWPGLREFISRNRNVN